MEIKAPNWRPDAVIDRRGWVCPQTGELLLARKFSAEQIEAYEKSLVPAKKKKARAKPKPKPAPDATIDKALIEMLAKAEVDQDIVLDNDAE